MLISQTYQPTVNPKSETFINTVLVFRSWNQVAFPKGKFYWCLRVRHFVISGSLEEQYSPFLRSEFACIFVLNKFLTDC